VQLASPLGTSGGMTQRVTHVETRAIKYHRFSITSGPSVGAYFPSSGTNVFNELEVFRASKTASKPINGLSTDFFPGYDLPPELSSSGF